MEKNIESHLNETRVFKPSREFAKKARIGSLEQYRRMIGNRSRSRKNSGRARRAS